MPAPLAGLAGIVGRVGASRAVTGAAARRAARGGARAGSRARLARMKRKRALGRAGRVFMSQMFGIDFPEAVQGSSSRGGIGGGGTGGGGGEGFDVTLPQKGGTKRYSKESNPSLSTLTEQAAELVKIAQKLGITSEKQEKALVDSVAQRERSSKEATLETDADATMVQGPGVGGESIEALEPEINKLVEAIRGLTDRIERGESGGSGLGGLGGLAAATGTAAMIGQGAAAVGKTAVSGAKKIGQGALRLAEKIGIGTSRVQNSGRGALLKGSALKKKIADIAKPLITKSLAKTGLKSIPIIGAVAGLGFALGRLLKGDFIGAGLDTVSGLAGPLTAVPTLVASLARDVYYGVYGAYPEQDPLVGERMPIIKDSLESLVKDQLEDKVETKEVKAPTPESKPSPTPTMAAPTMEQSGIGAGGGASSSAASAGGGEGAEGATAAPVDSGSGGGSAPASGDTESARASGGSGGVSEGSAPTPETKKQDAPAAPPVPPIQSAPPSAGVPIPAGDVGAAITAASEEEGTAIGPPTIPGTTITSPSTLPTTKANATGMGDVPEPSYLGAGDLVKTIYFGAVAGAMAA